MRSIRLTYNVHHVTLHSHERHIEDMAKVHMLDFATPHTLECKQCGESHRIYLMQDRERPVLLALLARGELTGVAKRRAEVFRGEAHGTL